LLRSGPATSRNPAIQAAAARPRNWARKKASPPKARAISQVHRARPTAARTGIWSPGSLAKAAPATQAARAMAAATTVSRATWAATFSAAMRRRPRGEAATRSRLPRRASPARVPDRARIDQKAAISSSTGPYFHCT
jgi:hypothetical protein